jgi:molybdenum cofactor biosynthesis enzyme MoaA
MKWFAILIILVVLGIGAYFIIADFQQVAEAKAEVARVQVELDTLEAKAARWEGKADSLALVNDSLENVFEESLFEAEQEAILLRAKADSLSDDLVGMIPEGRLRDLVAVRVIEIQDTYETRINTLSSNLVEARAIIMEKDNEIEMRIGLHMEQTEIIEGLERQKKILEDALKPVGILTNLKRNAGMVAGVIGVTVVGTLVVVAAGGG